MSRAVAIPASHLFATALCLGLAASVGVRVVSPALGLMALALAALALVTGRWSAAFLVAALFAAGWWWGSDRLRSLDSSALSQAIGSAAHVRAEVTGPARVTPYSFRLPVQVRGLDQSSIDEPAQLELPAAARPPPQGAVIEFVARLKAPRGPNDSSSFDEATYLRRRGVHVVLRADRYRIVGRRGGLAGVADHIREALAGSIAPGLSGERRALVDGIVLGADEGLDPELQARFRASGLYHLLAVSGQNVAYLVAGVLLAGWLLGAPRWLAQAAAIGAILCYVLAVGWQPSVVRAGIAGGLASLAWLASRGTDRWYFLLVGAAVLLAWSPYNLLDPGFQLSFSAVAAIFVVVPWIARRLEGYPLPRGLAAVLAVSAGCGLATAPILWLHFGAVPILSVPANALAEPVVAPILGLGLAAAAVGTVLPGAALALAWVNGWLAAYLAWCARLIGGLPFAQIRSGAVLLALVGFVAATLFVRRAPRSWRLPAVALALAAAVALAGWKL